MKCANAHADAKLRLLIADEFSINCNYFANRCES